MFVVYSLLFVGAAAAAIKQESERKYLHNSHESCLLMSIQRDKAAVEAEAGRIHAAEPSLCSSVVRLSVCVSVSQSERLQRRVQSRRRGAQMHVQSRVLCSLNSVNPSAVLKPRTHKRLLCFRR